MCRYPAGDRPAWIQDTMDTMATMCHRCRAVSCVCIDAGDRAADGGGAGGRAGPGSGICIITVPWLLLAPRTRTAAAGQHRAG